MLRLFFTVVLFGSIFSTVAKADDLKTYRDAGKALIDQVIAKAIDEAKVKSEVDRMVGAAVSLTKSYVKKYPSGEKLLGEVISKVDTIKALSFEEIEKQWHDLNYFKGKDFGLDLGDEDNEHFTDPIHCIVHPLMALKAAQAFISSNDAKHLQTMQEELSEGLEQASNIEARLK